MGNMPPRWPTEAVNLNLDESATSNSGAAYVHTSLRGLCECSI